MTVVKEKPITKAQYLAVEPGTVVYHQGRRCVLSDAYMRPNGEQVWWYLREDGEGRKGTWRVLASRFSPARPDCDPRFRGTWGDHYEPEEAPPVPEFILCPWCSIRVRTYGDPDRLYEHRKVECVGEPGVRTVQRVLAEENDLEVEPKDDGGSVERRRRDSYRLEGGR